MRVVEAIALWYWSKVSPNEVMGQSSLWVMKMRTE